jgi:menaquinol-cytochrome c reductase iron-sulfur subunit
MNNEQQDMQPDVGEHVVEADSPARRRVLSLLAGTIVTITGAGIIAPLAGMFLSPLFRRRDELWLDLGELSDVAPDAPTKFVYKYVRMDGWFEKTIYGTAYVVHDGTELVALSNICTHLGCGVRWDVDRKRFVCPCHNGMFDRNGDVLSGPPPKPLRRFPVKVVRGKIRIQVEEA